MTNNPNPSRTSNMNSNDMVLEEKRKKVGNYIILKTIGEGSFAKVRLGVHLITDMKVAVKVINKREVFQRNYLRANLRREASMMQRMSHTNIVQLHEVMETENSYYIVMDLVEGSEFVKYLTRKRQLDENETRKYIRQIVSAVDHMHQANVIHRDIKLQNFMLDKNNDIVIIDFGLSNALDEKGFLTTQCGSPAYAAPEIFAHQEYGPAVDIWSIGVNMYAMLLGKLPFKVENRSRNLAKLHACILKGCEIPNTLSRDCQDLLSRLLEPTPNKRISIPEILQHPFLIGQLGPIQLIPYRRYSDAKEINKTVVRYLAFKHGYAENDIEDAIIHRKPIAPRALYFLIERRLKEGLGWPDRTYNHSTATTTSVPNGTSNHDIPSEILALDKLDRQEPLLPGRRIYRAPGSSLSTNATKLSREKSHCGFDEQIFTRNMNPATNLAHASSDDTLDDVAPNTRLPNRKYNHENVSRKTPAISDKHEFNEDVRVLRRINNTNGLLPLKSPMNNQRNVLGTSHNQRMKPRSLPNSTLDHANQNDFHSSNDPHLSRTPKPMSRASHMEQSKKATSHSPMRYNHTPSVTVKAIGLFLKNSGLQSRVSSCSSRSSKSTGPNAFEVVPQSPPLKFYPSTTANTKSRQTSVNYHSHGNLASNNPSRQAFVNTKVSPHRLSASKVQHSSATTPSGQKLMPT